MQRARSWSRGAGRSGRILLALGIPLLLALNTADAVTADVVPAITETTSGLSAGDGANVIARGPDGAMWFTEWGPSRIGRVAPDGTIAQQPAVLTAGARPSGIVAEGGKLWVTEYAAGQIAAIDAATGTLVGEYLIPAGTTSHPAGITVGPDGALWFAENGTGRVGRLDPAAASPGTANGMTEYIISDTYAPVQIVTGPDGLLWTTFDGPIGGVASLDPAQVHDGTTDGHKIYPLPTAASTPEGIVVGPDQALWVAEYAANQLVRIDPAAVHAGTSDGMTEYPAGGTPLLIATGADDNLWFSDNVGHQLVRFVPGTHATTAFGASAGVGGDATGVAADAAGNVWFTVFGNGFAPGVGKVALATTGGGGGPPPPLDAPTPVLAAVRAGADVRLSAVGTSVPAGASVASYTFQLGGGAGSQVTCPAQDPVVKAVVGGALNTQAQLTVTTTQGARATSTIALRLPAVAAPRVSLPAGFATGGARAHAALGDVPAVAFECTPAAGNPASPKTSPSVRRTFAGDTAPTSDTALPGSCFDTVTVGIIQGAGCFTEVDADHPLPAAESALLCEHKRLCSAVTRLRQPILTPAGTGTAQAVTGTFAFDAIYYSTQPVRIDGLEVDPVNGGAIVLARAGIVKTGFYKKDAAYLISSDAVVKLAGLPVSLTIPDYGAAYSTAQNDVNSIRQAYNDPASFAPSSLKAPATSLNSLVPTVDGKIDRSVSPEDLGVELGEFTVPGKLLPLPQLPDLPLTGTIRVNLTSIASATAAIHVELPGLLSDGNGHGLTGDTSLTLDNRQGLRLDELDVKVPSLAQLGLARLKNLEFRYSRPTTLFDGKATLDLSDVVRGVVNAEVVFQHGDFQRAHVDYTANQGQGYPLFGPVFLTFLGADLTMNPTAIAGDARISIGPAATGTGCGALGAEGTGRIAFGNPVTLDLKGQTQLFCGDLGYSQNFHADSNGHVGYGVGVTYPVPGLGSFTGTLQGQAYTNLSDTFLAQLDGQLRADIKINECVDVGFSQQVCTGDIHTTASAGGTISIGDRQGRVVGGAGVCLHLNVNLPIIGNQGFDVGAGTNDLPQVLLSGYSGNFAAVASKFQVLLSGCNLSPWRLLPPPAGVARAGAHGAQSGAGTFQVGDGAPMQVVGLQGDGVTAPKVVLSGPGGKQIHALSDGITIDNGALIVRQPGTGQTLIEIPKAAAGRWTVQPVADSVGIRTLETATKLPDPAIAARVSGRGARRVLTWSSTSQPGLKVELLEGVGHGAHDLGPARAAHGSLRFTPAPGSGAARPIIARLLRNGTLERSVVVGHYRPGVVRPGRASRVRASRTRAGWRITFAPGTNATGHLVTVRFADGVQLLLATGRRGSLTVARRVDATVPTSISVVALRGTARAAPAIVEAHSRRRA